MCIYAILGRPACRCMTCTSYNDCPVFYARRVRYRRITIVPRFGTFEDTRLSKCKKVWVRCIVINTPTAGRELYITADVDRVRAQRPIQLGGEGVFWGIRRPALSRAICT